MQQYHVDMCEKVALDVLESLFDRFEHEAEDCREAQMMISTAISMINTYYVLAMYSKKENIQDYLTIITDESHVNLKRIMEEKLYEKKSIV